MRKISVVLLVVCTAAALVAASPDAGDAKHRKKPRTRIAYNLSLQLTQTHEQQTTGAPGVLHKYREETTFEGKSSRFSLVNRGTPAAPRYEIQPAGKTFGALALRGPVDYVGTGFTAGSKDGVLCNVYWVLAITADNTASIQVLLARNRFLRLSITSKATMVQRYAGNDCGVILPGYEVPWQAGPVNSPTDYYSAALPPKLGAVTPKSIKFGRRFTLKRIDDPVSDPALHRKYPTSGGDTVEESWHYIWTLKFTPVKRR